MHMTARQRPSLVTELPAVEIREVPPGYEQDVQPVKSASRALEVLETFRVIQAPLTLSEIGAAMSCPLSSMHMLLHSLVAQGYLFHDRVRRTYWPSPRVALLGSWMSDARVEVDKWLPVMHELALRTGETAMLGQRNGLHVQYIHGIVGARGSPFIVPIGSLRPMFRTAIGLVLAAKVPERDAMAMLRGCNIAETDRSLRLSEEEARRRLEECRSKGYAFTRAANTAGAAQIAVAIPSRYGHPDLALAVGGTVESMETEADAIIKTLLELMARYWTGAPRA